MLFSERQGYTPLRDSVQIEELDKESRVKIWNYWVTNFVRETASGRVIGELTDIKEEIWRIYFRKPLDEIPYNEKFVYNIKEQIITELWYEVMDLVELLCNCENKHVGLKGASETHNRIFEEEKIGYKIIDGKVTPITDEVEVESVDEAIERSKNFSGVREHIRKAIANLSDRKDPDYANSIKESISAVESISQKITGDESATLGEALNNLEDEIEIHGALKSGWLKLYGYTSDADGIRHAMSEKSNLSMTDAKYMLVTCAAFINYLISKLEEREVGVVAEN